MASDWNGWMETICRADLTVAEHRLAAALGRELLGWRKTSDRIGERRLRDRARLHGRSFEKARDGLGDKGLIRFTTGTIGRAGAGTYELVLPSHKMPAPERVIQSQEMPAPERVNRPRLNARSQNKEMPAPERARSGIKVKNSAQSADSQEHDRIRREAFDAYLSTGGQLTLERERGTLARTVTAALRADTEPTTILAACRSLGRERAFPGLLKQRVAELVAAGGPCANGGLARQMLTAAQLAACDCDRCGEWADALAGAES